MRGSLDGDGVFDLFLEHAAVRVTLFCELSAYTSDLQLAFLLLFSNLFDLELTTLRLTFCSLRGDHDSFS